LARKLLAAKGHLFRFSSPAIPRFYALITRNRTPLITLLHRRRGLVVTAFFRLVFSKRRIDSPVKSDQKTLKVDIHSYPS